MRGETSICTVQTAVVDKKNWTSGTSVVVAHEAVVKAVSWLSKL